VQGNVDRAMAGFQQHIAWILAPFIKGEGAVTRVNLYVDPARSLVEPQGKVPCIVGA